MEMKLTLRVALHVLEGFHQGELSYAAAADQVMMSMTTNARS